MSNKKSMSHNACYAPKPLSLLAVPRGFDLGSCRFQVCVDVHSDVTRAKVFFYFYHGMYWFSLHETSFMRCVIQSHPFLSMRNCIASFRDSMRVLRFIIDTPHVLRVLSKIDASAIRSASAEVRRSTTWIV